MSEPGSGFNPGPAATLLMANRKAGRPAGPLPQSIAPRDVAQGIAVQHEIARRLDALPPGGYKIGATGLRMQKHLNLPGPVAAFMRRQDILSSGDSVSFNRFAGPRVECEIAVQLARDLPFGHYTEQEVAEAVCRLSAAIEIVENRYGTPPTGGLEVVGTPTMIADQVYHAACVIGPAEPRWRNLDLTALRGRLLVDGIVRDEGVSADLLGHPLRCLVWLAASPTIAEFGQLRMGQVVMLGSIIPSVALAGPCLVQVQFDELPVAEVRFE